MTRLSQIDLAALIGAFDDVAQLDAAARGQLEHSGVRLASVEADEAGPVRAAAVQLESGAQYLLVEHRDHPERFIDVRARIDSGASQDVARAFLAAASVPESQVRWIRKAW